MPLDFISLLFQCKIQYNKQSTNPHKKSSTAAPPTTDPAITQGFPAPDTALNNNKFNNVAAKKPYFLDNNLKTLIIMPFWPS